MSTSGLSEAQDILQKRNDYDGRFFLGTVVDNNDPKKIERLRIRVPNLYGDEIPDADLPWCIPVKHRVRGTTGGNHSLCVPIVGSKMIVVLQDGDPYHPMYMGGFLTPEDLASVLTENYPNRYGFADEKGNHLYVDNATGDVEFHHFSGLNIHITPTGTLDIDGPEDLLVNFARDAVVEIGGNLTATVGGDASVDVGGSASVSAGTSIDVYAGASVTISAPSVSIN